MMKNEVKNQFPDRTCALRHPSAGWTLYFLCSIAIVGFSFAYLISIPLLLLGRLSRRLWITGGWVLAHAIKLILLLQPWFRADIQLNLPRIARNGPGYLTISNHRSHLDMFILLSRIPNIRALTKTSLYRLPFLALMMWVARMIPVRRGDTDSYVRSMDEAYEVLRSGDPVHIFPEMSRCPQNFKGTQDFHLLPFRMAQKAATPLVPIVFIGTDLAWPKGAFGIRFRIPIKVRALKPIDVTRFESAAALRTEVKRQIDCELLQHVT